MGRLRFLCPALACLPLGGCISGLIYQHTTAPLSVNFKDTPVGALEGKDDAKDLNLGYVRIVWDGNDIGGAARNAGINEIYYADVEEFSILGIWRQTYAHVYGK